MIAYKRKYLASIGAGEQDYVPCELCGTPAADIHHIRYRSAGGTDDLSNLVALCREPCHNNAHKGLIKASVLFEIAKKRVERNKCQDAEKPTMSF